MTFFSESHSLHNPVMDELRQKLEKHGQGHLLDFWGEITEDEKETLKADIDNVDLEYTIQSFERCTQAAEDKANAGKLDDRMMPVPSKDIQYTYLYLGTFWKHGLKVAFFQKVQCVFQISKKIFQITILNLKFKFPANKQQIQISSSG